MDQRADRRGALHGVWQPHVERDLGRLTHRAQEQKQSGDDGHALAHRTVVHRLERGGHAEAADLVPEEQDANQQPHIADAGDDEGLLGRLPRRWPFVPEADQQVGADANQFPGHIEQQEAVGKDDREHGGGEQRVDREVPVDARVAVHVAKGVDLHHQGHKGHEAQHGDGYRVNEEAPSQLYAAGKAGKAGIEPGAIVVAGERLGADGDVTSARWRPTLPSTRTGRSRRTRSPPRWRRWKAPRLCRAAGRR